MSRPENPTLQKYYDKALAEHDGDTAAAEQWLIEYACKRHRALDKDNTNKKMGVEADRTYQSRNLKKAAALANKCEARNGHGFRCMRPPHGEDVAHKF